ncbi:protein kinase [Streptomyces sp. NPDC052396]|uniref:protein kinase domain-containing protein n=1 Tax=Streptomyces sp. NPDC052396 TaxID=3365689 RepID=UPI0037CD4EB2
MKPLLPTDPREVGTYRLLARLGGGGMGQVYLGRSRGGRTVAVKLVRPELAEDADFRVRFAREVDAARRVGGFYTAQVVDADTRADPPWLVTSYIPGPSLGEAVGRFGPLPAETVTVLAAGLAEGLAAIHACGLVHRDFKPGNVILAEDGPRVIDFGIARALDATHLTRGGVIGTPAFMSPEQIRGQEAGPASDVFCLCAVLAYAATGRGPFGEGPTEAVMYRVVHDEPDLSGVPMEIAPLVKAGLAKNPADRPGLAEILDRCAERAGGLGHWLPAEVTTLVVNSLPREVPASPTQADYVPAQLSAHAGNYALSVPEFAGGRAMTLRRWCKQVGQAVNGGEPLAEVVVGQAATVITAPVGGVLGTVSRNAGDPVTPGSPIAVLHPPPGRVIPAVPVTTVRRRRRRRARLVLLMSLLLALLAVGPVSVWTPVFEDEVDGARPGDCVGLESGIPERWYTMPCTLMRARKATDGDGGHHFFKVVYRVPDGWEREQCAEHVKGWDRHDVARYRESPFADMVLCLRSL